MTQSSRSHPLLVAVGLAGGGFSGLSGVGGGAVMIPLLTGPLRMTQHAAHGTSLVIIAAAAGAGAIAYAADGNIDFGLAATLLPASVAGAYVGARFVQRVPALRLRQLFAGFLVLVGLRMLFQGDADALIEPGAAGELLFGALIGLAGGLASGVLGVGGGAIFVPGMVILLGTDQHEAQGVSLLVIVLTAVVGAWTHNRHGTVDTGSALWIAPAAIPAAVLGAWLASSLGTETLQRLFAVVVILVGLQMLGTSFRRPRPVARDGQPAEATPA